MGHNRSGSPASPQPRAGVSAWTPPLTRVRVSARSGARHGTERRAHEGAVARAARRAPAGLIAAAGSEGPGVDANAAWHPTPPTSEQATAQLPFTFTVPGGQGEQTPPLQLWEQHWGFFLHALPARFQASALASRPLRARAPAAAAPAGPRSVCRRDRVWSKLRTRRSNRSESTLVPSITMRRRAHLAPGRRKTPLSRSSTSASQRRRSGATSAPDGLLSEAGAVQATGNECQTTGVA
jgi:hypothetical protein